MKSSRRPASDSPVELQAALPPANNRPGFVARFGRLFAILIVAVPLWIIAWCEFDQWLIRSRYRTFLKSYHGAFQKPGNLYDNMSDPAKRWEEIATQARSLGLRHPSEWNQ